MELKKGTKLIYICEKTMKIKRSQVVRSNKLTYTVTGLRPVYKTSLKEKSSTTSSHIDLGVQAYLDTEENRSLLKEKIINYEQDLIEREAEKLFYVLQNYSTTAVYKAIERLSRGVIKVER